MKIFALFLALTGCAAASSEEKGKPFEVEILKHPPRASDAAHNMTSTARGGLTVSRRMTTVAHVSNQGQFIAALADDAVIELADNIVLTATITINGYTGLVIKGNNYKVDGNNVVRCFVINGNAEVSFNDLTITNGKDNGAGLYINDATASFTSCTFSSNEAPNAGGGIYVDLLATVNLIGCAFTGNTANAGGGDIYRVPGTTQYPQGTLNFYSLCPASEEYAGTGYLDCYNCAGPTDLSDTSECTACGVDTYSCCGATECSASASSCSAAEQAICEWTPILAPTGTCFHGATQVTLEDKSTKAMTELQVGDKIQTADIHGNLDFAPIISLPHKAGNSEMATFLKIVTDSGKSVQMTPGHLIPNCAGKMFSANEVALGNCVMTVDGREAVSEITSATHFGVYTAVTAHAMIAANGIIASPFSIENDPHHHKDNDGISSSFVYFLNKMSGKVSTGLRGAKEPSNS